MQIIFPNLNAPFVLPGAYPTIASYNASAVKIYNAMGSLVRYVNKNMFSYNLKNASAYCNTTVVQNSRTKPVVIIIWLWYVILQLFKIPSSKMLTLR
jgi:hypothetical protein